MSPHETVWFACPSAQRALLSALQSLLVSEFWRPMDVPVCAPCLHGLVFMFSVCRSDRSPSHVFDTYLLLVQRLQAQPTFCLVGVVENLPWTPSMCFCSSGCKRTSATINGPVDHCLPKKELDRKSFEKGARSLLSCLQSEKTCKHCTDDGFSPQETRWRQTVRGLG